MTEIPESHRDLLDAQIATLATIDDDSFPQLSVVWFLYDDGVIRISLSSGRFKTRNLAKRPECSLLILDPQNPFRYLEVRGRARVEEDEGRALVAKVEQKYSADVSAYDAPDERRLAVTIEPVKVHAVDMSG
jgi:PPOX class probable F420-dependent enzyme